MVRKKKITQDEQDILNLDNEIKEIQKRFEEGILTTPPKRRLFKVDERIQYGAHNETYISEVYKNGLYYGIESINVKRSRDKPASNEKRIIEWHDIYPFKTKETSFAKEEKHRINQLNTSLSGLIMKMNHSGVDVDVEYQREHVWKLSDKISLIDSIFNNVEIGKMVFVQRDYGCEGKLFEIIDGKQRLTAINDFYEDRFKYNGYYFSELSRYDRHKFLDHSITYGYLVNPSKEAIFETFIKLNTTGKPMASKHIDHVKQLLNEL